jgi:hypothetical protein
MPLIWAKMEVCDVIIFMDSTLCKNMDNAMKNRGVLNSGPGFPLRGIDKIASGSVYSRPTVLILQTLWRLLSQHAFLRLDMEVP